MPAQTTTSQVMAKYGKSIKAAVQKTADVPYRPGIINLPPGISNGVARLVSCKIGEYKTGANQGKPFFQARGTVLFPEWVDTATGKMKVRGLQTMVQYPLCATKNAAGVVTEEEVNVGRAINEIKGLFGVDEYGNCLTDLSQFDYDIEAMCVALEEAEPTFSFTTSLRKARPNTQDADGVWENWHGACEYVGEEGNGMTDETAKAPVKPAPAQTPRKPATDPVKPVPNGSTTQGRPGKAAQAAQVIAKAKEPDPEPEQTVPPDFGDVDSLGAAAAAGDQAAVDLLTELAVKAGMPAEDIEAADSWLDVAAFVSGAVDDADAAAEPVEEPEPNDEPHVGDVVKHKTKGAKKAMDFTVTSVNKAQETVSLKSLDDGKTICKGVPWVEIIPT